MKLEQLYLANNLFTSIPESLGNVTSLWHLEINDNLIEGPLPLSFAQLRFMNYFYCQNNKIDGTATHLSTWRYLIDIDLSSNR